MAQNITLLGASYSDVPAVKLPKTGGGTATFTDVSDTTATASFVSTSKYFYTAAGVKTQGGATERAAQTLYPATYDQAIPPGTYLTGAQTFKAVLLTNLFAENIKKDVVVKVGDSADDDRITSITGTYEGSGGGGGVSTTGISLPYTTVYYTNANMEISTLKNWPANAVIGTLAIGIGIQDPTGTLSGVTLLTSKGSGASKVYIYEVTG